uniref:Uncharacterized protein n=1 Tax=Noccaea caerulescens TaxID=107243 RepID=A0A1J3IZE4_NOCCA
MMKVSLSLLVALTIWLQSVTRMRFSWAFLHFMGQFEAVRAVFPEFFIHEGNNGFTSVFKFNYNLFRKSLEPVDIHSDSGISLSEFKGFEVSNLFTNASEELLFPVVERKTLEVYPKGDLRGEAR